MFKMSTTEYNNLLFELSEKIDGLNALQRPPSPVPGDK